MLPPASDSLVPTGFTEVEPDELDQDAEVRDLSIPADMHRQRLDRALVALLPAFSRNHLKHLIEGGWVSMLADAKPVTKVAHLVKATEIYRVRLQSTDVSQAYAPQAMDLNRVFEDEHLRVIHKPVGLVVHPAPGHWSGTLLNGLLALDDPLKQVPRAGIVHRLDKDTSGLMVTARSRACMEALVDMIAQRRVQREYLAITQRPWRGGLEREVELAVGRDPRHRQRMAVVDLARQSGKPAHTSLSCLDSNDHGALVHCRLHTGRTHQIRVHMAAIGMPLLGDGLYGGCDTTDIQRQALHAFRLKFTHPFTGEPLAFEAPLPADMQAACAAMGLTTPPIE